MMTKQGLERFVGTYAGTRVQIPSDRRGEMIPAYTTLFVKEIVGDQHFNLGWPGVAGRAGRAANQIHHTKLFLTDR
jgi:hypothetical protein